MAYSLNTQQTVNRLKKGDVFTQKQSERIVNTIVDATSHLATKNDLKSLEQRFDNKLEKLETSVDYRFKEMDIKMDAMHTKIEATKSDIIAKMYIGFIGLGSVLIAAMAII